MTNEFKVHISRNHYLYKHSIKLFFYNYYVQQENRMRRRKDKKNKESITKESGKISEHVPTRKSKYLDFYIKECSKNKL